MIWKSMAAVALLLLAGCSDDECAKRGEPLESREAMMSLAHEVVHALHLPRSVSICKRRSPRPEEGPR